MPGVYGDILAHFPELIIRLPYFNQVAKIGAGYSPEGDVRIVECIKQAGPGRRLSGTTRTDFNAISPVLKVNDNVDLWCWERLNIGWFMLYQDEVYRISTEKDWALEAGFYAYRLEKLVGSDGREETALPIKQGEF